MAPSIIDQNQPSTSANSNKVTIQAKRATQKPLPIVAYNKAMIGIGISDQMASYVSTLGKGVKWYRKLAFELLLGISLVNAWVVFKHVRRKKVSICIFREELVDKLLNINHLLDPTPRPESTSPL